MAKRVILRQHECTLLVKNLKEYHEKQLEAVREGIKLIHDLLDCPDGFYAAKTFVQMKLVLECIETQIEPHLIRLFEDSEACVEELIEFINLKDQEV